MCEVFDAYVFANKEFSKVPADGHGLEWDRDKFPRVEAR